MNVIPACLDDLPAWNDLARQVEPLFGAPMADDASFQSILRKKIAQGLALCIRAGDGPPGVPLCGGLFFSTAHHPVYQIGWLAVDERWRRHGVARVLVEHTLALVMPPAEVIVTTFDASDPGGLPAWRFYESLGFSPAELLPNAGPNGEPRRRFRKHLPAGHHP